MEKKYKGKMTASEAKMMRDSLKSTRKIESGDNMIMRKRQEMEASKARESLKRSSKIEAGDNKLARKPKGMKCGGKVKK